MLGFTNGSFRVAGFALDPIKSVRKYGSDRYYRVAGDAKDLSACKPALIKIIGDQGASCSTVTILSRKGNTPT